MTAQHKTTLWIIYAAMVAATVVYPMLGVLFIAPPEAYAMSASLDPVMLVMLLIALSSGILSFVLFGSLVRGPIQSGKFDLTQEGDYGKVQTNMILCWSLAESSAVFSIVVLFLNASIVIPLVLAGFSLLMLVFETPAVAASRIN